MCLSMIHGAASFDHVLYVLTGRLAKTRPTSRQRNGLQGVEVTVGYLSLSRLGTQEAAKEVQALTLCFSRDAVTIVENLGLNDEQRGSVTDIIAAIQRYVEGHINESVERRTFFRHVQQPGETFDDFLVSLQELAKTCIFCSDDCTPKNIRNQIIEGLWDGDTVEHLLQKKDLTLDKAITACRAQEAAKEQQAEMVDTPRPSHQETLHQYKASAW